MGQTRRIALTVNGKRYEEEVEVRLTCEGAARQRSTEWHDDLAGDWNPGTLRRHQYENHDQPAVAYQLGDEVHHGSVGYRTKPGDS